MARAVVPAWLLLLGDVTMAAAAGRKCPAPATDAAATSTAAVRRAVLASGPSRIVCLGSSSTQGVGASGPAATYPALLAATLARRVEIGMEKDPG